MLEMRSLLALALCLAPAARNASANGTTVDLVNMQSALAVVECGAITDGTHTPAMQESADGTTWTDVAASDLVGAFVVCTANSVQRVAYNGNKRFIRVRMVVAGATTGAVTSAIVVGGNLRKAP